MEMNDGGIEWPFGSGPLALSEASSALPPWTYTGQAELPLKMLLSKT